MIMVSERTDHRLILAEVRIRHRISARLQARTLDAALATGGSPEFHAALAIRAHTITRPAARRHLARSLERILTEAARPAGLRPTPLTSCRRQALANATDDLNALITRLRSPRPVAARGVAQLVIMLSDAASPLHLGTTEPDLHTAIQETLAHLDDPVTMTSARNQFRGDRSPRGGRCPR